MTKKIKSEQKTAECRKSDALREAVKVVAEIDSQSGITQGTYVTEECSELIKELMKMQRGKGNYDDIIAEACDVLSSVFVLLFQYGVSEDFVREQILFKCRRAEERYSANGEV